MYRQIVPDILAKYGVVYATIGELQKGYRNESYAIALASGETVNLLFFKHELHIRERIGRADASSEYAAARGLSVRVRYDQRLLRIRDNTYAGLYTYLPGRTIAWEMYSMKHIKLLGWAMADLHHALADMPAPDMHTGYHELDELIARMGCYFNDPNVSMAAWQKLGVRVDVAQFGTFNRLLAYLARQPNQQMLHMDMVRGNVLFDTAQPHDRWQIGKISLTGIIDFEKAAYGHPVCDIARTLAFLLVDCPKPNDKVRKYFLESGYIKRGQATIACSEALEPLVRLFLIHDFYKFLRHTPYESLANNHHYVRTRDLLENYGMISLKS